jgi:ribosomal protein L11 methyltransferase
MLPVFTCKSKHSGVSVCELLSMEIIGSSPEEIEKLTLLLSLKVHYGWEEEDLPVGRTLFRIHASSGRFMLELETELKKLFPPPEFSVDRVKAQNWVESWKEFFTPVEAGSRFVVLPPWLEEQQKNSGRIPIIIEPKTAFGTGHHASTALCLAALSDLFDAGRIRPGNTFLDLGTGSGILGIAAASLKLIGEGVDPDLTAVENALENRGLNNIAPEAFAVRQGSLEAAEGGSFDLIMANILAEPLVNMSAGIMQRKNRGGTVMLSGILLTQSGEIRAAYAPLGEPRLFTRDEWACLVWTR